MVEHEKVNVLQLFRQIWPQTLSDDWCILWDHNFNRIIFEASEWQSQHGTKRHPYDDNTFSTIVATLNYYIQLNSFQAVSYGSNEEVESWKPVILLENLLKMLKHHRITQTNKIILTETIKFRIKFSASRLAGFIKNKVYIQNQNLSVLEHTIIHKFKLNNEFWTDLLQKLKHCYHDTRKQIKYNLTDLSDGDYVRLFLHGYAKFQLQYYAMFDLFSFKLRHEQDKFKYLNNCLLLSNIQNEKCTINIGTQLSNILRLDKKLNEQIFKCNKILNEFEIEPLYQLNATRGALEIRCNQTNVCVCVFFGFGVLL